jgi:hypothetical protein
MFTYVKHGGDVHYHTQESAISPGRNGGGRRCCGGGTLRVCNTCGRE